MIVIRRDKLNLVEPTNELLHRPAKVFDFKTETDSAKSVATVLFERMKELGGIGLSANQVGLDIRLFVLGVSDDFITVYNPEILEYSNDVEALDEGSMSYPGIMLNIKRSKKIKVRYQDNIGNYIETEFTGITARIFQHEYDHIMGIDFASKVSKFKLDFSKKKFANKKKKIIKKYATKTLIEALNGNKNT
jgi:peptide deformylase